MEPGYITQAKALLGEKEIAGKLDNPKIIELYADAGHDEIQHDEVPWCAAFVGACLARANLPNTGTLLALDYKNYGVPTEGNQPELYCIGVKTRGSSTWEGHVGFVVAFDDDTVSLLGGNQHVCRCTVHGGCGAWHCTGRCAGWRDLVPRQEVQLPPFAQSHLG